MARIKCVFGNRSNVIPDHPTGSPTESNQQLQSSEKGKAPFQEQRYQKVVNEIGLTEDLNVRPDEVKVVVTLRSGKKLKLAIPELVKSAPLVADPL